MKQQDDYISAYENIEFPFVLFSHLNRISKAISELDASDSVLFYAQAVRLFYLVRALEAFISPYLSDSYFRAVRELLEPKDGTTYVEHSLKLLELLIKEMDRLGLLLTKEEAWMV